MKETVPGRPWSLVVYPILALIAGWMGIASTDSEEAFLTFTFGCPAFFFVVACIRERGRVSTIWVIAGIAASAGAAFLLAVGASGL